MCYIVPPALGALVELLLIMCIPNDLLHALGALIELLLIMCIPSITIILAAHCHCAPASCTRPLHLSTDGLEFGDVYGHGANGIAP